MTDNVAYKGEAQLLRWSDSNSGGPTITLLLPSSEDLDRFRGATVRKGGRAGQLYAVMIVEVEEFNGTESSPPANDNKQKPVNGPHGDFYQILWKSGWFYNPAVWRAVGTDEQFLAWLRTQPCACAKSLTGSIDCGGDVVAAHVRRVANGAGTGIKPQYSAIPMCDAHHRWQHQHGETPFGGPEWFDKQRGEHLVRWVKSCLYERLGVTSLADVHPAVFMDLINELGAGHTLPRSAS